MNREKILNDIIEIVDSEEQISESTIITSSNDFDSLTLMNILAYIKRLGIDVLITDFISCKTVGDIITLIHNKLK